MEFLQDLLATYGQFFSWDAIVGTLSDPANWGIIFSLIIIEGLLSADNALVLAAMVKGLPEHQRKKALVYGIWGAYVFRFIAIGLGIFLIKLWWIKIIGGGYLLWLGIKFFWDKWKAAQSGEEDGEGEEEGEEEGIKKSGIIFRLFGQFWGTVFMVELMDIAFSIDSVLAAFAISDELWVIFLGAIFGILMMRGVAGLFLKLLEKIPEMEAAAFVIILFIGAKMLLAAFGIHITDAFGLEGHTAETWDKVIFVGFLVVIFAVTIAKHYLGKKNA